MESIRLRLALARRRWHRTLLWHWWRTLRAWWLWRRRPSTAAVFQQWLDALTPLCEWLEAWREVAESGVFSQEGKGG